MKEVQQWIKGRVRYCGGMSGKVNTSFGLGVYTTDTLEWNTILHRLHLGNSEMRTCYARWVSLLSWEFCFNEEIQGVLGQHRLSNDCRDWEKYLKALQITLTRQKKQTTQLPVPIRIHTPFLPTARLSRQAWYLSSSPLRTWHRVSKLQYLSTTTRAEHGQGRTLIFSWYWLNRAKWVCQADRAMKDNHHVSESNYIPQMYLLPYSMELWVETVLHQIGHGLIDTLIEAIDCVLVYHNILDAVSCCIPCGWRPPSRHLDQDEESYF